MKIKNVLCLAILSFGMLGCDKPTEEQLKITQDNFKSPTYIGTLPDGRTVFRVYVQVNHDRHSVYFFDKDDRSNEITVNYPVRRGKTTHNEVIVMLDGIPVSTNIISK